MALRRDPAKSVLKAHREMVQKHYAYATSRPAAYITSMAKKLVSADIHEKLVIAHALAEVKHPADQKAAAKLLSKLAKEKEALIVRRTAVVGLGHLKAVEYTPLLEELLKSNAPKELKRDAAWALRKIEGKKGISLAILKEALIR